MSYSLSSIVGKDLLGSLGAESLLFWRFGIASVVLWTALLVWRRRGGPDPFDVPRWRSLALGMLFGVMVYLGFLSLEYLDVSVYIVLVYLYPVLVVVGSSMAAIRPKVEKLRDGFTQKEFRDALPFLRALRIWMSELP
mgnify:CR=1 FL=1